MSRSAHLEKSDLNHTQLKCPQALNLSLADPNKAAPQLCEMELYRVHLGVIIRHVV